MGKPPGRPALPANQKRSVAVFAYFTPEEARRLRQRRKPGQSMSELVREALLSGHPPPGAEPNSEEPKPTRKTPAPANPSPDEAEAIIRAYGREMGKREIYSRAALAVAQKHPRHAADAADMARRQKRSPEELVGYLKEHGPEWDKT